MTTIQAVQIDRNGGREVLQLRERTLPPPAAGEVQVTLTYAGVNYIDIYQRRGNRQPAPLPAVLGKEGAGTVAALGEGVEGLELGQRVAFGTAAGGGYATAVNLPAGALAPVPDGVTDEQSAAVMLQGMTAHYLARSLYPLSAGEVAVIHAAAGGVGGLLTQIARQLGAVVIATASTPEKRAEARRLGAEVAVDYGDVVAEARARAGAHVVYDGVGAATFMAGLDALRVRGMMALYGAASGAVPDFDPQLLNSKGGLFLTRPSLVHYTRTPAELRERAGELFGWLATGQLELRVDQVFALTEVARAHAYLEERQTRGKVLLKVG